MVGNWPFFPLSELTINYDARRVPIKEADRRLGLYPYYGASGIVDYVNDYIFDGEYLLIAEDGENLRTRQTPVAFMASGRFWVNNHAHVVTGNGNASTRFINYALQCTDISSYLTGAVMPKLTQSNLNRIEIPVPSQIIQNRIVDILGVLDDKIKLNRQVAKTLEAMAQALFKSWFVDFGPVRAKAEGRPAKLPDGVAVLFPDQLGKDGLPEGWNAATLLDFFDLEGGGRRRPRWPITGTATSHGFPWLIRPCRGFMCMILNECSLRPVWRTVPRLYCQRTLRSSLLAVPWEK